MLDVLFLLIGAGIGWFISNHYYRKQKIETQQENLLKHKQRLIDKVDLYFVCFRQDKELKRALISLAYTIQHERYFSIQFSLDVQEALFGLDLSKNDKNNTKIALITTIERLYNKYHAYNFLES